MTADGPLILFSRKDCHLCDLAGRMLDGAGIQWLPVDIDADPELASRYGLHVPVLMQPDSGRQLFFPFNEEQLALFLEDQP